MSRHPWDSVSISPLCRSAIPQSTPVVGIQLFIQGILGKSSCTSLHIIFSKYMCSMKYRVIIHTKTGYLYRHINHILPLNKNGEAGLCAYTIGCKESIATLKAHKLKPLNFSDLFQAYTYTPWSS